MPTVTDAKPAEPSDPEYLEKKAAAQASYGAGDYAGAKRIYTELLYDPRTRNAVVYSNRSLMNLKLKLPLSALHDAQVACRLSDSKWRKAWLRLAEAATPLNMHELAERCFVFGGQQDRAAEAARTEQLRLEEARRTPSNPEEARKIEHESHGVLTAATEEMLLGFCAYMVRPQLPPVNPATSERVLDGINRKLRRFGIEVRDAPGMGRGIFATRTVKRGEVILVEEPFVAGFADGDRCQQCFREFVPTPEFPHPPHPIACPGCGIERYCSEKCRQKAWELYHRVQCEHAAGLQALREFCATGRFSKAVAPVLIARLAGMTLCSPEWPCHTLSLPQMHFLSPPPGGVTMDVKQLLESYQRLDRILDLSADPRFDLEWFEAVFVVLTNNTFIVSREGNYRAGVDGAKRGSGLYPTASFFNHSCEPNATYDAGLCDLRGHDFNSIVVRATKQIRAGEQMFIPYSPVDMPYELRQASLLSYGFECCCSRCEREKPRK